MAQLQVTVIEGRNLKRKDFLSENDTFVELYLDYKSQTQKTKVERNSKTPVWNQTFVFNHLQGEDILHVGVYDEDAFTNDRIGLLEIDLRDLYQKRHIDNWYTLPSRSHLSSHGEIHLILDYEPLKV